MWPVLWTVVRTYAPYVTFPVAFVVGAVGYHLEWFIRGKAPQPVEEEKSISERREDRKLDELLGKDHTQVEPVFCILLPCWSLLLLMMLKGGMLSSNPSDIT
uniref:Small integral membrane protein 12 n=1 Tax=Castor canadensis TaxID=51338 RepID=A0A8C0XAI6_CASCN